MAGPTFIRGVRVPAESRLPVVVTDEWLAAVTEAGWSCTCQRLGDRGTCTHVGWCTGGAADQLVLDETGRVLCTRCAGVRARKAAARKRARAEQLMAAAQGSLLDLPEGAGR